MYGNRPAIPISLITLGYPSKFDHRPTDSEGDLAFAVYISPVTLSLKSLIICKQLIKMGIWDRRCKCHWETCEALREQMKLPLDPTIRINDCKGRARQCGGYKGSVWSASHLICINTSGMSESHKAVIMSGQIRPSLPAFDWHTSIRLVSLGRRGDAGLSGDIGHFEEWNPHQWEKPHKVTIVIPLTSSLAPTPFSILHVFLAVQKDFQRWPSREWLPYSFIKAWNDPQCICPE